ncbi:hypothetical protein BGZ58_009657, partial [Dissophora ornata]
QEYDLYRLWDAYDAPYHYILLKSVAYPTSYQTAGWSFVASIPANNSAYFDGAWPGFVCTVDSLGVVTLVVSSTGPAGSVTSTNHARGIQWDPAGANTIVNTTGTGGWSLIDSTTNIIWAWTATSTLGMINLRPTLIYVDSYTTLSFADLDPVSKILTWESNTWNLQTIGAAFTLDLLAHANNKLYMVGANVDTMYLATLPLTAIGPTPATSLMTVSNYAMPGLNHGACYVSGYYSMMTVVGNDLYILCSSGSSSTIYHHDGVNWTSPIVMPSVPWSTPGAGRFVRSPSGQLWAYVQEYTDIFTITIIGNSANWTRVDPVNITQAFGTYTGPTPTLTPSSLPSNGSSSGDSGGIGGGAIAGIIIGVLVVLVGVFFVIRSGRKKSNVSSKDISNVAAEGGISGKEEPNGTYQARHVQPPPVPAKGPIMTSSAYFNQSTVPGTQYQYAGPNGTHSYPVSYSQQVSVPGSAFPSTQPYTVAQPYPTTSWISPHVTVAPQVYPQVAQVAQVSAAPGDVSPNQSNLSDLRFSVHPRPNFVQGASVVDDSSSWSPSSVPSSAAVGIAVTPPIVPMNSRPERSPNNPEYHPTQ